MTRPTEQQVRQLRDAAMEFEQLVNQHIEQRNMHDPEFRCPTYDIDGMDNDAEFDFHDNGTIVVHWRDYDRCGEAEYFRREFPFADLWDQSWYYRVKEQKTK